MSKRDTEGREQDTDRGEADVEEVFLEDARAKRAYLAHMRHELRTPINAIIGYSELLLEDAVDEGYEEFVPDLDKILAAGRELLDHVAAVLDPLGIEERTELDLEEYGINIRHALRTPLNTVVGFSEMLIEDGEEQGLDAQVDDLRKIHSSARNMLSYINEIINLTQLDAGKVRKNKDTRKVMQVMAAIQPLEDAAEEAVEGGEILVVDDNPTNRQLLNRRLSRQGHHVTEAENGRAALELLRQDPRFDVVLLDIIMPEMNGYEALLQIKADPGLTHIPVIMLSSLDELDSVVACIEHGADEYLPRPFNPVILQARLEACLEKKRLRDREQEYLEQIRVEKEKSERLLLNILPGPIAERLKANEGIIVDSFPEATVLFADIVGFTHLSTLISPKELINMLNSIFSAFDRLATRHGLEKIKTIGDAYMAVGGLMGGRPDHAPAVADFALEMLVAIDAVSKETGRTLQLRIGINTGPVIAGVIGESKFIYDLWGDTVNTASRMESHGQVSRIHCTTAAYERLRDGYQLTKRGTIPVKGKGEMETYFLDGKRT